MDGGDDPCGAVPTIPGDGTIDGEMGFGVLGADVTLFVLLSKWKEAFPWFERGFDDATDEAGDVTDAPDGDGLYMT